MSRDSVFMLLPPSRSIGPKIAARHREGSELTPVELASDDLDFGSVRP